MNQIALDFRKPEVDLVQPGAIRRREVEMDPGMGGEELFHPLGLMRRQVVADYVDLLALGDLRQEVGQERDKRLAGVTLGRLAETEAGLRLECCVERERAVPDVFKAVPLGPAGRQRQNRIRAIERLDGGLLFA